MCARLLFSFLLWFPRVLLLSQDFSLSIGSVFCRLSLEDASACALLLGLHFLFVVSSSSARYGRRLLPRPLRREETFTCVFLLVTNRYIGVSGRQREKERGRQKEVREIYVKVHVTALLEFFRCLFPFMHSFKM